MWFLWASTPCDWITEVIPVLCPSVDVRLDYRKLALPNRTLGVVSEIAVYQSPAAKTATCQPSRPSWSQVRVQLAGPPLPVDDTWSLRREVPSLCEVAEL